MRLDSLGRLRDPSHARRDLRHALPSMTQDVYLGRKATGGRAATALEDVLRSDSDRKSVGKVWDEEDHDE